MSSDAQNSPSFDEIVRLNDQLDQQLQDFQQNKSSADAISKSLSWKTLLAKLSLLSISIFIPFVVLIRTSVYMYQQYRLNGWMALAIGVLATIVLLVGYGIIVTYRYRKSIGVHKYIIRGIVVLVIAYTVYGTLYYAGLNTKTDEIQSYYRSLHPIMRVALATITLADSDLLVTDIQREPDDYAQMGLAENQHSLHYVQLDGYVHAVDLRTRGRAEWKNWVTRMVANIIGLQSIRHVGTADHLHVYLGLNK